MGCGCVGLVLTCAVIWMTVETWEIYKNEMVWLASVHRVEFMIANGRLPFDGRELNIWVGREIGLGDRLPPLNFECGLFNCGNSDEKALETMTKMRISLWENVASFSSSLEFMRISDKMNLKLMVKEFQNVSNPFDLRYGMLRKIGVWLSLSHRFNDGCVGASDRQNAINILWDVAQDGKSPFCGIALYGLLRNVGLAGDHDRLRYIIQGYSTNVNSHVISRAAANYLLKELPLE